MKRLLILFSFFIFHFSLMDAQSWQPVGKGLNYEGYVNTFFVYDSVMYAGGLFTGPGNNIAQWNGTTWDSLGSGIDNEVYAISNYKGLVYVGGWFSEAGGQSAGSIATWNGVNFANAGFDIEGGRVNTLAVNDSLLYIGGDNFDSVNHELLVTGGIASWNGSTIKPMFVDTFSDDITSMIVFEGNLWIAESWYETDIWNTASNYNFGGDFFSTQGKCTIFSTITYNLRLCVAGDFVKAGKDFTQNIVVWNDTAWGNFGSGINGPVYALTAYKNLLIAGGSFDSAGGIPVNNIAAWNGTTWSALGNGVNGPVYALAVFDSSLYAGGDFTSPGNGIVVFKDSLPVSKPAINNAFIYPNPASGKFTIQLSAVNNQSRIEIYNILGEEIYSSIPVSQNTVIDLSAQPSGVYMYRILISNGNLISTGKLVKE